jgi:hypothetical protein
LAQIASTVARIVFGIRKAVGGSDIFNVVLLVVHNGIYDIVLIDLRSGNETGWQLNREVWTFVILIFPSRDVADNLLDAVVAKLLKDRSGRMPL